jgi:hypothetical protein
MKLMDEYFLLVIFYTSFTFPLMIVSRFIKTGIYATMCNTDFPDGSGHGKISKWRRQELK